MGLRRTWKVFKRNHVIKSVKKSRKTLDELSLMIPKQCALTVAKLFREKSISKSDSKRTSIDDKIDLLTMQLCFTEFGATRPRNRKEFEEAHLQVLKRERLDSISQNKTGAEISKLHYSAEAKFGEGIDYFHFTLLFPSVRTALVRKAQQALKAGSN
jgi:hypothetical protein